MKTEIDIVIMASGSSVRFGKENKLLHEIAGRPMFMHVIDHAAGAMMRCKHIANRLIVVSCYEPIKEYCHQMCSRMEERGERIEIRYVENTAPERGISHTIQLGLANVCENCGVMFLVADQPYTSSKELYTFLTSYVNQDKPLGAMANHAKEPMNPCIFMPQYFDELYDLHGDRGGKGVIERYLTQTFLYEVTDDAQLKDIDRPEDA
jgi:molybdenum cofactor cytidylyltransferase